MKKIEAIIRPSKVKDVCAVLEQLGHPSIMFSEIEGHGSQQRPQQQIHGRTYKTKFLTKAKIQVITEDSNTAKTVNAIRLAACTGEVGDGKIFIYPVEDVVRIRSGEQGIAAL